MITHAQQRGSLTDALKYQSDRLTLMRAIQKFSYLTDIEGVNQYGSGNACSLLVVCLVGWLVGWLVGCFVFTAL